MKSVYSAVRTGSLNQTDTVSSLRVIEYVSLQGLLLFLALAIVVTKFNISSVNKTPNFPSSSFYDGARWPKE